jgi:hypothetical protein
MVPVVYTAVRLAVKHGVRDGRRAAMQKGGAMRCS